MIYIYILICYVCASVCVCACLLYEVKYYKILIYDCT